METRHIKLDYENALDSKKQLLSTELNLLNIIKKIKEYRRLRKKEMVTKNKLKTSLATIKTKINLFESTFPKQERQIVKKTKQQKTKHEKDLQQELEEIQKKLSRLN